MNTENQDRINQQKWSELLTQAVSQPGLILKAYTALRIPGQTGRRFRTKPATDSRANRPPIPTPNRPLFPESPEWAAGLSECPAGLP